MALGINNNILEIEVTDEPLEELKKSHKYSAMIYKFIEIDRFSSNQRAKDKRDELNILVNPSSFTF